LSEKLDYLVTTAKLQMLGKCIENSIGTRDATYLLREAMAAAYNLGAQEMADLIQQLVKEGKISVKVT
jgi:hypothetical protein